MIRFLTLHLIVAMRSRSAGFHGTVESPYSRTGVARDYPPNGNPDDQSAAGTSWWT